MRSPPSKRRAKVRFRKARSAPEREPSHSTGRAGSAPARASSRARTAERRAKPSAIVDLPNESMTPLFEAAVEATEEAVINSLFAATPVDGAQGHVDALPVDEVVKLYKRARR